MHLPQLINQGWIVPNNTVCKLVQHWHQDSSCACNNPVMRGRWCSNGLIMGGPPSVDYLLFFGKIKESCLFTLLWVILEHEIHNLIVVATILHLLWIKTISTSIGTRQLNRNQKMPTFAPPIRKRMDSTFIKGNTFSSANNPFFAFSSFSSLFVSTRLRQDVNQLSDRWRKYEIRGGKKTTDVFLAVPPPEYQVSAMLML